MQINPYQWNLYLQAGGQETVDRFAAWIRHQTDGFIPFVQSLVSAYCPDDTLKEEIAEQITDYIDLSSEESSVSDTVEDVSQENENGKDSDESAPWSYQDEADDCWNLLKSTKEDDDGKEAKDREIFESFSCSLVYFSLIEFALSPDDFIPYFFIRSYHVLTAIASTFEIELPPLPKRQDYRARFDHYFELSATFTRLREEMGWKPEELCAFLYDYAPKAAGGLNWLWEKLPEPTSAFVIGGPPDFAVPPEKDSIISWQGNPDTQPGDMILFYQWAPASCFSSIWRAAAPGFIDPFFWYYRCIYLSNRQIIAPIKFSELKADAVFQNNALVRTHMQGMDGTELKPSEYNHFLDMLHQKSESTDALPRLDARFEADAQEGPIATERDVEILLLEPLLERLGWKKEQYIRQMPLRMGRGSTVYPDYVILPQFMPGHEKGWWIVEAKKSIPSERQRKEGCGQATSYARRLSTDGFLLVAQEGVWVSEKRDDFNHVDYYSWEALQSPDVFSKLSNIMGNKRRRQRKQS